MKSTSACPDCGGSGWKTLESEDQQGVAHCHCYQENKLQRVMISASIPPRHAECSFENFEAMTPKLSLAKTMALHFVENYPLVDCGLLILGPCGVGKTHLAVSILRGLVFRHEVDCLFYDFRELLKNIQHSFNPVVRTTEWQVLQPVLQSEVLVLDDLGAERPTEWVRDTFAYIINHRYNQKRTTVITSNFEDREANYQVLTDGSQVSREETLTERIGHRLRSRLYEMCKVIKIPGADFRIKVKQAQYQF